MAANVRSSAVYVVLLWNSRLLNFNQELEPRLSPRLLALPGAERRAFASGARHAAQPPLAYPIIPCEAMPVGGQFSSFMPSDRPRWASTSLISVSDFLPRFGVFNSSTSVFWIRSPM